MLIDEYFTHIENVISRVPIILITELTKDKRSLHIGLLEGRLYFQDGSLLQFVEFVDVKTSIERYKYSYHYQDKKGQLVFRYDMAPHHQDIPTSPHHKHLPSGDVEQSKAPTLQEILSEIEERFVARKDQRT